MKTLIVNKDGKLSVEECSMPKYNDCQALVKTLSCGVCNGTDGKLIHRTFKGFEQDVYPVMLGHEGVGRVIEIGKKVTSYKVGDIVLLPFAGPLDEYTCGWGSFSEYGVVCDKEAYIANGVSLDSPDFPECAYAQNVIPSHIDTTDASMIITLREVLSSIKRFKIEPNDSVVVFGCGPVGLTFIKFLRMLGVHPIIALDIVDNKLEEAKKRGATYTFNSKDNFEKKILDICKGGVKYVIDAVGVSAIINQSMPLLKDQGAICCYGISANLNFDINWSRAPYNWKLHFQQFPSKKEESEAHEQVMAYIESGVIDLKDYISDVVDFDHILDAFEKLERKEIAKKCIIKYE